MKKEVYIHLLKTYGHLPLLWIGIAAEIVRSIIFRIGIVTMIAIIAANLVSGQSEQAMNNLLIFALLYVLGVVVGVIGELISVRITEREYVTLLGTYYKKLTGKDMAFYRDHQTGYLSNLFRDHLDGTIALVRLYRGDIIRMFIGLIGPVLILILINIKLGLLLGATVIVLAGYVIWSSKQLNTYRKPTQEVYKKLTGEVADQLVNAAAFKASSYSEKAYDVVLNLAHKEQELFWFRRRAGILYDVPRTLLTGVAIFISSILVINNASTISESVALIILTFTFLLNIMQSIADLPDLILRHDEHIARVHPTLTYLTNTYETITDSEDAKSFQISNGTISVRQVNFSYKDQHAENSAKEVFKDLNIEIKGGEHVGIVGLSGAGKSTLAGLLMRFDDVDSGEILVDGVNIKHIKQNDLRKQIAFIPQEPLLFHSSIKENINYFKKEATYEEIIKAAQIAHADTFINDLPKSYETIVGERGTKLSGGQKQRIAIARAILKQAPIIIFDEATSALDSESERIIQDALPEIIKNSTALVIAHRLSTVARLDRILVMDGGKIVEQGTHQELLAMQGKYAELWKKQIHSE